MRARRLLIVLIAISIVAITARWWLPAVLKVLSVNQDLIQTLDSGISIVSNVIAALSALGSFILWQEQRKPEIEESLDQRNRRILLNHVENFWVKGVLEKSLHGAAMLELGIKEDPEAVTYPWAIKKEATDETLPADMSMLAIFEQIGMGRSLLILGAPGSGKTTMLLELARQLIERARQNADEPIPMVFNLAPWTEKLSLADWLAQELNNIYYVPRKSAPDWVKGNKLLLLLDGLDEVRQESRAKCVDAINQFRKEHGLTSLAVCSRSQDYEELGTKLSFEGAIEVQPLTQKQITAFFNRFGKEMAGLKQVLKKDSVLREMAETPLFLSIMVMTYRDKLDVDILASQDVEAQRKHLFINYIERMFEHPHSTKYTFQKQDVTHWLSWLAQKMIENNAVPYSLENMQPRWISLKKRSFYRLIGGFIITVICALIGGLNGRLIGGLISGISFGLALWLFVPFEEIEMVDTLIWNWKQGTQGLFKGLIGGLLYGLVSGLIGGLSFGWIYGLIYGFSFGLVANLSFGLSVGMIIGLAGGLIGGLSNGLSAKSISQTTYPGQRISLSTKNSLFVLFSTTLIGGAIVGLVIELSHGLILGLSTSLIIGLIEVVIIGLVGGLIFGGFAIVQHFILRFIISVNNLLPWKLIPFLDYCTDLIFLRRVGGGYIFVHRLLMEHFAAMDKDEESDQRIRSG